MTRSFDVFFDLRLNKRLSKHHGDLGRYRAHYDVTVMFRGCRLECPFTGAWLYGWSVPSLSGRWEGCMHHAIEPTHKVRTYTEEHRITGYLLYYFTLSKAIGRWEVHGHVCQLKQSVLVSNSFTCHHLMAIYCLIIQSQQLVSEPTQIARFLGPTWAPCWPHEPGYLGTHQIPYVTLWTLKPHIST